MLSTILVIVTDEILLYSGTIQIRGVSKSLQFSPFLLITHTQKAVLFSGFFQILQTFDLIYDNILG